MSEKKYFPGLLNHEHKSRFIIITFIMCLPTIEFNSIIIVIIII